MLVREISATLQESQPERQIKWLLAENVVVQDVTLRKQLEVERQLVLEREKALSELRSHLVSMVSHDIRGPLTTILGAAELLEFFGDNLTEEKRTEYIGHIKSSVEQTTNFLTDVLLLLKAEAGKMSFKPGWVNLEAFCQTLLNELKMSTGKNHNLSFINNCAAEEAFLDMKLLRQILPNLLSNAVKYLAAGSTVKFEIFCDETRYIFRIEDNGIGISLADQEKLFNPFYRASNVGDVPGTGLGLVIVKKSVELHSGQLEVKSVVGQGTTFSVILPC